MRIQHLTILALVAASVCEAFCPIARSPTRCARPLQSSEADSELHDVRWLAEWAADNEDQTLGEAIGQGEAVVCIPEVADPDECQALYRSALTARDGQGPAARGRSRFSVSDPEAFSSEVVLLCDEILLRVLDHLDDEIPSIFETLFVPDNMEDWPNVQPLNAQGEQPTVPPPDHLFDTCESLRELYLMGELEWSEGEPAINVYEGGGYFGAHKDHLALTVLIPLTSPGTNFDGGGTGFWEGNREVDENPQTQPDLILKPEAGSALIFGGDVTHAACQLSQGIVRSLFALLAPRRPCHRKIDCMGCKRHPKSVPTSKGLCR